MHRSVRTPIAIVSTVLVLSTMNIRPADAAGSFDHQRV